MTNKEIIKKQIIYRSTHRGTKEMELLLGGFVKKYVDQFSNAELNDLEKLLLIDDEILFDLYFKKKRDGCIAVNRVTEMFEIYKF